MTQAPSIAGEPAKLRENAEAFYIETRSNHLFGWLHRPAGAQRDLALLICNPFGYEALCAHRSLRTFAETAAALGVPALRFDYAGTGDSSDLDPDEDQLAIWSQNVIAAVRALRERTSVSRVVVLGVRLGATLAALAASRCEDITMLILMAPVVRGPNYLRELRMIQVASSLAVEATVLGPFSLDKGAAGSDNPLDVVGYTLSAATVRALAQIDLTALEARSVKNILVLDDEQLPRARDLAGALGRHGAAVHYATTGGYVEMMMTAPHLSQVPASLHDHFRGWLADHIAADGTPAMPAVPAMDARSYERPFFGTDQFIERPVFVDAAGELFGIVTEPVTAAASPRVVILLSIGADNHIGASRIYVGLGREWARQGLYVLRLDLGGIGDSATRPERRADDFLPAEALADIRTAMDFMCARYGVADITLAGVCSGAYHALRAAVAGLPVRQILLVNPDQFLPLPGPRRDGLAVAEIINNPHVYRRKILSAAAWLNLLRGNVKVWRIPLVYGRRATLSIDGWRRRLWKRAGLRLANDLDHELRSVAARGVRMAFVFSKGEPGLELLRIQAGNTPYEIGDHCRIHLIDFGDHTFSRLGPRLAMTNALTEELFVAAM